MRTSMGTLLRQIQPSDAEGWAASREGQHVLNDVLRTPRDTPSTSRRTGVIAVVAVVCAVVAVLAIPRLVGGPPLDTYRAGDIAFFEHIQVGGPAAEEVERYETLAAGSAAANAVVVAEVVDVRKTRVITGQEDPARFPMVGVVIRPVEVIAGSLPREYADELTVEFMGRSGRIDDMKATLPQGRSVWFLREKGGAERPYYRITSSQGLFVQGEAHVVDPVSAVEPRGMAAEGETYETMSHLVQALRNM